MVTMGDYKLCIGDLNPNLDQHQHSNSIILTPLNKEAHNSFTNPLQEDSLRTSTPISRCPRCHKCLKCIKCLRCLRCLRCQKCICIQCSKWIRCHKCNRCIWEEDLKILTHSKSSRNFSRMIYLSRICSLRMHLDNRFNNKWGLLCNIGIY